MKKICAFLLVLALLCCQGALAENELQVVQSSMTPVEMYDGYYVAYFVVEITNTGDENLMVDNAPLRIMDANGEMLYENEMFLSFPVVLRPGENAYMWDQANAEDDLAMKNAAAYTFEIQPGEPYSEPEVEITVTNTEIVERETYSGKEYRILLTVSNDQEEIVFHPTVAYGLYDEAGKLIYADGNTFYDVGILPGQSTVFAFYIDDSLHSVWMEAQTIPHTVKGMAYLELTE